MLSEDTIGVASIFALWGVKRGEEVKAVHVKIRKYVVFESNL